MICEICGCNNWRRLDSVWSRCVCCGRIESGLPSRKCRICKSPIGKYAKKSLTICNDCKEKRQRKICTTVGCLNPIKPESNYDVCVHCLQNRYDFDRPDGEKWRSMALTYMMSPTRLPTLVDYLRKEYPVLKRDSINSWLIRSEKYGLIKRLKRGLYQTKVAIHKVSA
jgi:hypothetical protein